MKTTKLWIRITFLQKAEETRMLEHRARGSTIQDGRCTSGISITNLKGARGTRKLARRDSARVRGIRKAYGMSITF